MNSRASSDSSREVLTRRFLVLLFADIVGSTRLMSGMDPEDAHQLFSRAISIMKAGVRRYRGNVVKVPGDGVLAVFGVNHASQNDALQACLAAQEMHKSFRLAALGDPGLRSIELRIGIHAGNVIVHGSESDYGSELDTRGYAVNAAHKIEAACPPGETLVSDDVAALAGDWLVTERVDLDSISTDAAALSPRLVKSLSSSFSVESLFQKSRHALLGREGELEMISNALSSSSGEAACVGILGQAGIGKSRLTLEVIERYRQSGWRIVESRGLDFLSMSSYSALAPLIPQLIGLPDNATHDAVEAGLTAKAALHGLSINPLLDVLGLNFPDSDYHRSDPAAKAAAITQSFHQLFSLNHTADTPLLLVIEDIHLIDQRSFDVLAHLAAHLAGNGFKLLASSRPEGRTRLEQMGARTLAIGPLERSKATDLVGQLWTSDTPLAPDVVAAIIDRANCLPFGIIAYIRSLAGTGQVGLDDVPASIEASVQSQRDRLSEEALNILDHIVISRGGLERAVQDILFGPAEQVAGALDELRAGDLVVRDNDGTYSLDHDLIGHASLRFILKADRIKLHRQLMQALETQTEFRVRPERLARHAHEGGRLDDALKYYWKACLAEISRGSLVAITNIYENAMAICNELGSAADKYVADFALITFDPFHQQGLHRELEERLVRAAEIYDALGEPLLRAQTLGHLSILAWMHAKHAHALDLAETAYSASAEDPSSSLSIILRYCMSSALQALGRLPEAISIYDDLLAKLDQRASVGKRPLSWRPDVLSRAMNVWCLAQTGEFEQGWQLLSDGKALSDEEHLPYTAIMIYAAEGLLSQACGRYEASRAAFQKSYELCMTRDRLAMAPKSAAGTAQAMTRTGDAAGAVRLLKASIDAGLHERGGRMSMIVLHTALAEAHCVNKEANRALEVADQAVFYARECDEPPSLLVALLTHGDVNLQLENIELARKSYREAAQLAEQTHMRPAHAHALAGLALCDVCHGRAAVPEVLDRAINAYTELGLTEKANQLRQRAAGDPKSRAAPWLHDAV